CGPVVAPTSGAVAAAARGRPRAVGVSGVVVGGDGGGGSGPPQTFAACSVAHPAPGVLPATGHFPSGAGAFGWIGVVGPMARTIADVRALFEVMAGPAAGDAHSAPVPLRSYTEKDLRPTRIGLLQSSPRCNATPETRAPGD